MHLSSLIKLYNEHMRGTELVKNNSIAMLKCLNHTVKGYPLNFNSGYNAQLDKEGMFAMSWAVIDHSLIDLRLTTKGLEDNFDPSVLLNNQKKAFVAQKRRAFKE